MAAVGRTFAQAGVVGVYCLHGTFAGNDALGLYTELERYAPRAAHALRRITKRAFDAVIGETGNYTPEFAERMESALSAGAARPLPVRLFHWASQNHHISRADAAVRLIDELASVAEGILAPSPSWGGLGRGVGPGTSDATANRGSPPPLAPPHEGEGDTRVLLWAHSHGGNAVAILTNLLGSDELTRSEFFRAARVFHRRWRSGRIDFPVWERVERLLADATHPLRRLQLDVVTFGTPVRYGWDALGYGNLLHFVNHRPAPDRAVHAAPYPPHFRRLVTGREGDFLQHVGIAGTNFPPLPLALRTFLADRRLGRLLQRGLPREWLRTRLKRGVRVHHDGTTLLVEYEDPDRSPHRHLLGHAPYTRSRWMALHCEFVAEHFYGSASPP